MVNKIKYCCYKLWKNTLASIFFINTSRPSNEAIVLRNILTFVTNLTKLLNHSC